jgi:hypothetical protein
MIRNPIRTIVPAWSWKAAACSAVVRGLAFFVTNLQSGHSAATKAMLVEAVYAIFAGGLIGAVSQQLRRAKPLSATAPLICIGLPGVMTLAQLALHHFAGTPHQSAGLLVSLCFAALTASYSWYAMRCGAMLGGTEATTVWHDLQSLPRITLDFLLLAPRYQPGKPSSGQSKRLYDGTYRNDGLICSSLHIGPPSYKGPSSRMKTGGTPS